MSDVSAVVEKRMAEFKNELRKMSKNDLIRSYVAQYAQTVRYSVQLNEAIEVINKLKAITPEQGEKSV